MNVNLDGNYVKIGITDIDGIIRGKYVHFDKLEQAKSNGLGFCNVIFGWDMHDDCIDGQEISGWHNGYMDYKLGIDLHSKRKLPKEDNITFYFGDYYGQNNPAEAVCPRAILRRILDKASRYDVDPIFGTDIEWFNFKKSNISNRSPEELEQSTITSGMFGYSLTRLFENKAFFEELLKSALRMSIPIEGLHTETGPGVIEAALQKTDALKMADNMILFKTFVKQLGLEYDITPTFMAKWNSALPGCSAHLHHSNNNEKNTFGFNEKGDLNKITRQFLAGQLTLLPEFMVLYAPTVNSYKRYVSGSWAPTTVSWGIENRTTAVRVIPENDMKLRLEMRVPGSDANPYLAIAATLASGLHGIENDLFLEHEAITNNAYRSEGLNPLCSNLKEATDLFYHSTHARKIFGDTFVEHYAKTRYLEWEKYMASVSDWELKRYFETT